MPFGLRFVVPAALAVASVLAAAPALADPYLSIATQKWSSKDGACTKTIARASVTGVPADVRARVDALLAKMLNDNLPDAGSQATWSASCAKNVASNAAFTKQIGHAYQEYEQADWSRGFAHGRWLSARLHVTEYSGGAHPSDNYVAVTFDLTHAGYPVPSAGFSTGSRLARFNAAVLKAEIAATKIALPDQPAADVTSQLTAEAQGRHVDAAQILLTTKGIELTALEDSEAARNFIVPVSFAALGGLGTPGGPLDPSTR